MKIMVRDGAGLAGCLLLIMTRDRQPTSLDSAAGLPGKNPPHLGAQIEIKKINTINPRF